MYPENFFFYINFSNSFVDFNSPAKAIYFCWICLWQFFQQFCNLFMFRAIYSWIYNLFLVSLLFALYSGVFIDEFEQVNIGLVPSRQSPVRRTYCLNLLSVNPTKYGQAHSNNPSAVCRQLFECIWPFCGVGA